eukprot:XP_001707820.1 Hypothetical protein GL50803_2714 [Giardia lamblia ATCC 50803]
MRAHKAQQQPCCRPVEDAFAALRLEVQNPEDVRLLHPEL